MPSLSEGFSGVAGGLRIYSSFDYERLVVDPPRAEPPTRLEADEEALVEPDEELLPVELANKSRFASCYYNCCL